ncbi:hypothetical protein V6N13_022859 [Hibiscus sabdariffa]
MSSSDGVGGSFMDWRKLFAANESQPLHFFPPQVSDGEILIQPPNEMFDVGVRVWETSLMAHFLGRPPNFSSLQYFVNLLWGRVGLSYIASALGTPLYMDGITANRQCLAYAKVCVDMSADFKLPRYICVQLRDGTMATVVVEVPWYPPRCSQCLVFGHSDKGCDRRKDVQM